MATASDAKDSFRKPQNEAPVPAIATLMAYPDILIEGRFDSLNWEITHKDGSTGCKLLAKATPTFE
jgi:hypothetical protein